MKIKLSVFCWFLSLVWAITTEGFTVRGPAGPVVVPRGASVTLPCSVDTPLPLQELEVQWMREDSGSQVHLFQGGESRPESQSPPFNGRAQFFTEEISGGNFSLLLRNVTAEDKGVYKCVVHTELESQETQVKIDVEWLIVTGADVPVSAYVGEDVTLNCSVDTHVPLSELEVQWMKTNGEILVLLFAEGENRPESQHERFSGRAEFFSEEIPKGNFSLKLRDFNSEDSGEYMCKVHTGRESGNATAWLQKQGFSTLHIWILGIIGAASVFAVFSCIPELWYISKSKKEKNEQVKSNRALSLYCLQVSVPCILISIAFAIWGIIEGFVGEAYVCSAINLTRILVIFRVAPYALPDKCCKRLNVALPLENFVIRTGINSVLLHNVFTYQAPDTARKLFCGFMYAVVLLYDLSAVCVSGLRSSSGSDYLKRMIRTELFFLIFMRSAFGFTVVFMLWFVIPDVKFLLYLWRNSWSSKRYEYLCRKIIDVLEYIIDCTFYPLFLHILSEKDTEHSALMCFIAFCYILNAVLAFDHRSNLPAITHILVYVFGSAALSVLNSVSLATEIFLKVEKGARTVEDLQLIVLPLECFFLACWLGLQVYAYCMQDEKMREQLRLIVQRFKTCGKSSKASQTSDEDEEMTSDEDEEMASEEAVEMVPLSQPAQSPTHRQEVPEKVVEMLCGRTAAGGPTADSSPRSRFFSAGSRDATSCPVGGICDVALLSGYPTTSAGAGGAVDEGRFWKPGASVPGRTAQAIISEPTLQ